MTGKHEENSDPSEQHREQVSIDVGSPQWERDRELEDKPAPEVEKRTWRDGRPPQTPDNYRQTP